MTDVPRSPGPTAHDRFVVPKRTVSVELEPIREDPFDVVESVRTLGMPSDLNLLDGSQVFVRLRFELGELGSQELHLIGYVDALSVGQIEQFVDLGLDLHNVPLEL